MDTRNILQKMRENIHAVLRGDPVLGEPLWKEFLELHPADIANFFEDSPKELFHELFIKLPREMKLEVFSELSEVMKVESLDFMTEQEQADALNDLPADELTDLFDLFSDEELKENLSLLHKKARQNVLSLMKFHPESAGGIMETEVFTLMEDFTVEKSVKLMQRLQLSKDIHQEIYITDHGHKLVGVIKLEDLVLHRSNTLISTIMKEVEFVARADEDREHIASKMMHYDLVTIPVANENNHFLGIIPSSTLVHVLIEEASEDLQKMSALAPMKYTYFETNFFRLFFERSYILVALLVTQSFAALIMGRFEMMPALMFFTTMLVGTGGNSSSQTSAVVIQGLMAGELRAANISRFLRREFMMSILLAGVLSCVGFIRVFLTTYNLIQSIAISCSLFMIVITAVNLGSMIPLLLRRLNIDPAFSAGPFLATLMDILGTLIYCYVSQLILGN